MEEIVRQVGHLSELYEDAQSEKYQIKTYVLSDCITTLIDGIFPKIPEASKPLIPSNLVKTPDP